MAGNRAVAKAGIDMDRSVRGERALEPSIGPSREPYACTTEPSTGRYTTCPLSPRGFACGSRLTRVELMASRIVLVHCGVGRQTRPKPRSDRSEPLRGRNLQAAEG